MEWNPAREMGNPWNPGVKECGQWGGQGAQDKSKQGVPLVAVWSKALGAQHRGLLRDCLGIKNGCSTDISLMLMSLINHVVGYTTLH